MKKIVLTLIILVSFSAMADKMSDDIKKLGEQIIKDRIDQIRRIEQTGCDGFQVSLEGILLGLSGDAQSIAADATGTQNPERKDDMANMYRERLPIHAKELSRRLKELADAAALCL